jgi:hypothetical protein
MLSIENTQKGRIDPLHMFSVQPFPLHRLQSIML